MVRIAEQVGGPLPPGWGGGTAAELGSDDVHVWHVRPEECRGAELVSTTLALLDDTDRARHASLRHEADRHRLIVSRALTRAALSSYDGVPFDAWKFSRTRYGRPEVARPATRLRFSVSHTHGLVACAVARMRCVGIDVEQITPGMPIVAMARQVLAPAERQALVLHRGVDESARFLELWTLKEAFVKATGRGLSIAPREVVIDDLADPIALRSAPPGTERRGWEFTRWRPTANHVAALCVGAVGRGA